MTLGQNLINPSPSLPALDAINRRVRELNAHQVRRKAAQSATAPSALSTTKPPPAEDGLQPSGPKHKTRELPPATRRPTHKAHRALMAHIPPTLTRSTAATNIKLRDESLQHRPEGTAQLRKGRMGIQTGLSRCFPSSAVDIP
jgi:hypothetical protein